MHPGYNIYDLTLRGLFGIMKKVLMAKDSGKNSKTRRFIRMQENFRKDLKQIPTKKNKKRIWFHASSLGEYQIARPIMEELKKRGDVTVILTFFSPTGIDALKGKKSPADMILPLPLDTIKNSRDFLDAVQPDAAVFMVAELWPNFINEIERRKIPSAIYSALMQKPFSRFSIKGALKTSMIKRISLVATHDSKSLQNLRETGCKNAVRMPDPLFDNAISMTRIPYDNKIIEAFIGKNKEEKKKVIVAGSLHPDKDLELIGALAKEYPELKIILVPHEINMGTISKIKEKVPGEIKLHSECDVTTDLQDVNCLVIDYVGDLSKIYRYADMAYVGGGFTRLLHSVVEPLAYGLPVAFGPMIYRKSLPLEMIENGTGTIVQTPADIIEWEKNQTPENLRNVRQNALRMCEENAGGAQKAAELILKIEQR